MELNLAGDKVAVFGAARGIGRVIADEFLAEGCEVHGFDLSIPEGVDAPGFHVRQGDVTQEVEVKDFIRHMGTPDHVIFCVGIGSGKFGFPYWNLKPEDWMRVLEVNLMGAVCVAHAVGPAMAKRGSGSLLFLASVAGQIGSPTDPPYSAAKAGLINFMQCVARDLAPYGVRANALSPGMVQTDLNRSVWAAGQALLPEEERQDYDTWGSEKVRRTSPLGRWQTPPEFAAMAVYLASDHARNITGQTLNIDGGQVMHS